MGTRNASASRSASPTGGKSIRERRTRLALALMAIAGLAAIWTVSARGRHLPAHPGVLSVRDGSALVARVPLSPYVHGDQLRADALARRVETLVSGERGLYTGAVTIRYRLRTAGITGSLARLGVAGGPIELQREPVSASIAALPVRQLLQNDCESAALQILLATLGRRADQLVLQQQLVRSGPLDPVDTGSGRVWGDPAQGFVGRADGSGPAGGFGVYDRPMRALAARQGVRLRDLSGESFAALAQRVLQGHAVMAWVGLSDGPYATWRTPDGRSVTVNYGEHVVVVSGVTADGALLIVNPLSGAQETWAASDFQIKWGRLGRRALSS